MTDQSGRSATQPPRSVTVLLAALGALTLALFASETFGTPYRTPLTRVGLAFGDVSPNGDGVRDRLRIVFRTRRAGRVTVTATGPDGMRRTIVAGRRARAGRNEVVWAPAGVPDGVHAIDLAFDDGRRTARFERLRARLDTRPPVVTAAMLAPAPGPDGALAVSATVDEDARVTLRTSTAGGGRAAVEALGHARAGAPLAGAWRPPPGPGPYRVVLVATDAAGNRAVTDLGERAGAP